MSLCGKEGKAHAAADHDAVGLGGQRLDDAELVRHLRSAEHHRIRPLGGAGQLLEHPDLVGDQRARIVRQQGGHVVDRRLFAVHHTEAVGDESASGLTNSASCRASAKRWPSSLLVSRASKRTFSRSRMSPSVRPSARASASLPTTSPANCTCRPSCSPSAAATGASDSLVGAVFGTA